MNENCKKLVNTIIAQVKELEIEFEKSEGGVLEASIHGQDWRFKKEGEFLTQVRNSKTGKFEDVKEIELEFLCGMLADRLQERCLDAKEKMEESALLCELREAEIEVPDLESKENIADLEIENFLLLTRLEEAMEEDGSKDIKPRNFSRLSALNQKTK